MPATTSGTYGTNARYVLFDDFPQSHKADDVVIDESQKIVMGGLEYYPGSDGSEATSETFDDLASRQVNDTQDKVFILSIKETAYYVRNSIDVEYQYGAPSDRFRTHTDYSLAQANKYGSVYAVDDTYDYGENPDDYAMINGVAYRVWRNNMAFYRQYGNAAAYWLRTPARASSSCQDVGWDGIAGASSMQTNINQLGVVPALCLK